MITLQEYDHAAERAVRTMTQTQIIITSEEERARFEVADYGLSELEKTGLEVLAYVDTERVCAKQIVMFLHQTCPEHRHLTIGSKPGKEETFSCSRGTVYLYLPGTPAEKPSARPPRGSETHYSVKHEICLRPGGQYALVPNTKHWFQSGQWELSCPSFRHAAMMMKVTSPTRGSNGYLR